MPVLLPGRAARAAFDTFLRTFTFVPVSATPMPLTPTITAVPTPTSKPWIGADWQKKQRIDR